MDQNLTHIAVLVDRSGSMQGSEDDVVGGLNAFLEEQKKVPGKATVTIARFDDVYETIMESIDLSAIRALVRDDFTPRGGTALYDSFHRLMVGEGARLAAMPEEKRPSKVIFLVFSDGGENQSKEVNGHAVLAKVKEQETKYNWKFLLFGMNLDGIALGATVGIKGISSMKGHAGVMRSAKAASAYVGNTRMGNVQAAELVYASKHVDDEGTSRGIAEFEESLKNTTGSTPSSES